MALRIASRFTLPLEYQTHSAAILAQRRKGKTYLASVIAEEMAKQRLPFVVLDPTGAWWGLRSSADGKRAGYPVVIIGGEHGDLPLVADSGKVIADLIVDRPGFYVIDLSLTESQAEQDRFVTAFNKRLYRRKAKVKDPLHVFIDEADEFAPQRADKGQGHLLSSTETLVRRGGLRGIGVTLISQRPAVIHKNVLTQVDVMFVLRMTGKQDIDAIDSWVRDNATPEQRKEFKARITRLPLGTGWVWSPGWLECFKEIAVRERHTFNSSATPEVGVKPVSPTKLAPVDVAAISAEIEATIERAKENDPTRLRQEVVRLRRELDKRQAPAAPPAVEKLIEVLIPWSPEDIARLNALADEVERRFVYEITPEFTEAKGRLIELRKQIKLMSDKAESIQLPAPTPGKTHTFKAKHVAALPKQTTDLTGAERRSGVTGVEQRILDGIAWFSPLGIHRPSRVQVAIMAGYHERTKSYINALGALKSRGLIDHGNGTVELLDPGAANFPTTTQTNEDLHRAVIAKLSPMYGRMLQLLIDRWPNAIKRDQLAETLGYHERTKSFLNALGRLRSLSLAEYPSAGEMRASDALFPIEWHD